MKLRHLAAATALPAMLITAGPAPAQNQPTTDAPQAAPQKQRLTKEKLDAFVTAAVEIRHLGETWKPKIDAAATEQEAEALRSSARAEMVAAIEETPGITPQEYIGIGRAARQNPQLQQAIVEAVDARLETAPSGG